MTSPDQPLYEPAWNQTLDRVQLFWTIMLYVVIVLSLQSIITSQPDLLWSWSGLVVIGALVLFCGLYHRVYLRVRTWPMPPRTARLYFGTQIALTLILSLFSLFFANLAWALLFHASNTLRPRHWPIPFVPLMLLTSLTFRLPEAIAERNWILPIIFVFAMCSVVAIQLILWLLFNQRYQLVELVEQLHTAKAEVEAYAAQAEELAALRERTRLAREMHDSLGHALVVMNVKLEAAQRLYKKDPTRGEVELVETRNLIREAMTELRHSLADLRAPLPGRADLSTALHHTIVEVQQRTRLALALDLPQALPELSPELSTTLWRIAREALTNVEKHAAAASATVTLEHTNGTLTLRVLDDGSGIQPGDLQKASHFGITGMRERIEAFGGTLHITSRSSGGTLVEARVPFAPQESGSD